ncbi:hypothetical protein [Mesonia sp. K7]|uniref:hypothetical protein n=1 Tax=Mesonia sp. K7 TaxID=2218606 RepID=UPI0011B8108F|nr:hypothetical protein [Mesonia sp. K7]
MKKVLIPQCILEDLQKEIRSTNLQIDVAVFFVSLLISIPAEYRIDIKKAIEDNVPLDSQILKSYRHNYDDYIDFLVNNNIIEKVRNHGADINQCSVYKISGLYSITDLVEYQITDVCLSKKFDQNGLDKFDLKKMRLSGQLRPHLVKNFDEDLKINFESANKLIEEMKFESEKQIAYYKMCMHQFNNQSWKYSIKPDTDNRLHSSITRVPKALREFIFYENKHLVAVDIKTSQPYFLSVLIKAILKKDKELLRKIGATKILSDEVIEGLFDLKLDRDDLINFVESVINPEGDFYLYLGEIIEIKQDKEGNYFRIRSAFSNKKKRKGLYKEQTKEIFLSKREAIKDLVMELLYASPKYNTKEASQFRKAFPSVHKIIQFLHRKNVPLHHLLQNIEAITLLDKVAKTISEKHPYMPLFSVHDSLVTTSSFSRLLKKEMEEEINKITTLKVKTEYEYWNKS